MSPQKYSISFSILWGNESSYLFTTGAFYWSINSACRTWKLAAFTDKILNEQWLRERQVWDSSTIVSHPLGMSNILNYKQHSERGYRCDLGKRLSLFPLLVLLPHISGDFWDPGWWWSLFLLSTRCQASLFLGQWLKGMGTKCCFFLTEVIVCATGLLECFISRAQSTFVKFVVQA